MHWSPRSAEIVYIKSCILCWVTVLPGHPIFDLSISTCSSYKLLFFQSKSKQQASSNKPGARIFLLDSSNYQKTVPWRNFLNKVQSKKFKEKKKKNKNTVQGCCFTLSLVMSSLFIYIYRHWFPATEAESR